MSVWRRWVRTPQRVKLRAAIFQVHLWTGIAVGLYLVVLCVSGSIVIYRNDLFRAFTNRPRIVSTNPRWTPAQLKDAALRAYPGYAVSQVWLPKSPNRAAEIEFDRDGRKSQRLFDPYSGKDLGDPVRPGFRATVWLVDLHNNLLWGRNGRLVNGIGAIALTTLSLTGLVVWWPGIKKWRSSLTIEFGRGWKRANWSTHSALGIWSVAFILMWGISGIYFSFPKPFDAASHFLDPVDAATGLNRYGDAVVAALADAHFGRFGGRFSEAVWALVGLVPPALFLTGILMWVTRVVRRPR